MEQSRALNALQPYLALSKSATSSRAAADVITQATSAPNTYVFAELLLTRSIQALKNSDEADPTGIKYSAHHRLLEIFAWGTWADYSSSATTSLPRLNAQQAHKLHILTLLTLAATTTGTSSSSLTYARLITSLSLTSQRDLEKLVTAAVYNSLLSATLDSKAHMVRVSAVAPLRDLAPGSVSQMVGELDAWSQRCDAVLGDLELEIERVRREAAQRRKWHLVRERQIAAAASLTGSAASSSAAAGGGGGSGGAGAKGGFGKSLAHHGSSSAASAAAAAAVAAGDVMDEGGDDIMDVDDGPASGRAKRGSKSGSSGAAARKR
ncbi:hypothetical protein AAFC00_003496 [Neodothiora populina]|uniref:PCI domain-containing protein n=1 Tax=Neodothiora populina TaxID=2781224 RepID=A0ABR3PEM0_9PEZI